MTEVLLFHHALGCTSAVEEFATDLQQAGHRVHVPDLFDGQTFSTVEDGVAYAEQIGFPELVRRGREAARILPSDLVYIGLSLGVLPAQILAQTRPGARAAALIHACLPHREIGAWPDGVRVQVHAAEADPIFVGDGDLQAARALVEATADAELFLYPGDQHLFAETGTNSFDEQATTVLRQHVHELLDALTSKAG